MSDMYSLTLLCINPGGETIREINRQSGAHVELDRNPPPNPNEKLFIIRGNPGQIQHAIQLIQEKTGQQGMPHDQRMVRICHIMLLMLSKTSII